MIFLDPYAPHILKAKENHLEKLFPIVQHRVNALPVSELKTFLNESRIKRILTDLPNDLSYHHISMLFFITSLSNEEWQDYLIIKKKPKRNRDASERIIFNKYNDFILRINNIFKYKDGFSKKETKYSTYDLAETLNIQTCVYCNRIYTKTVVKPSKRTRPEFDHWYPKESYPLLALSFYNLIPSCHICNSSVKGSIVMNTSHYLHPYLSEKINFKFSYWIESLNAYKFQIKRIPNSKEDNTIKAFKLEEIYETHKDEIHDLVQLRKLYSVDYLLRLRGLLAVVDTKISNEEIYRLAFGVNIKEKDFSKRPLSRMKRDILNELGMI
ncbi:hypothetical protein [Algibacter mikhailovii]|uniref:hypothetical protein n=1 Tax=Algibacter mikhailovii TaxID=425498 RepID=UPI0024948005|nr:hypothetical protein [Algibacter mikhailovii]